MPLDVDHKVGVEQTQNELAQASNSVLKNTVSGLNAFNYAIAIHILAEKSCDARPEPIHKIFNNLLNKNDKPNTYLESLLTHMDNYSLNEFVIVLKPELKNSEQKISEYSKELVKKLGGCKHIVQENNKLLTHGLPEKK